MWYNRDLKRKRSSVSHQEFLGLHAAFVKSARSYFVEVEKSSTMLAECTARPMPLKKRLKLASQGIIEQAAHMAYLSAKTLMLNAARLGYAFAN
jgi:hypothetical protein